jgi:hypothetical protein
MKADGAVSSAARSTPKVGGPFVLLMMLRVWVSCEESALIGVVVDLVLV